MRTTARGTACRSRRENNGFDGADAVLEFNKPLQVAHIQFLQNMAKEGTFTYVGRKDEPVSKFYSGDCGIITELVGLACHDQEVREVQSSVPA